MDFNTIETYIVRRIQSLEGQVERLTREKEQAEGERDAAASLATWLLSKYKMKTLERGPRFFTADNIYEDHHAEDFTRLYAAKEADDEQ